MYLKYTGICLKYNVKDITVKLGNIYKRKAHSELYQTSKIELFENP